LLTHKPYHIPFSSALERHGGDGRSGHSKAVFRGLSSRGKRLHRSELRDHQPRHRVRRTLQTNNFLIESGIFGLAFIFLFGITFFFILFCVCVCLWFCVLRLFA
jgi:hypothetical protein